MYTFADMNVDLQQVMQRFGIVGRHPDFLRAIETAVQVAPTDMTVLITGESGVGKEVFPKIIHAHSLRKHQGYIAVNCGAIPEGTIDSELFGHRKGSFTGAISDRKGYFEEANGGTIFLDEVGELPIATQARLLRVLESGEFIPVGASKPQRTNVRVVAATNVNIQEAIARGRFREDLYYRLNTVPISIPPLRKRTEDIVLLFKLFAAQSAERNQIPLLELSPEAAIELQKYSWPGNIRELRNATERMSILEMDRHLSAEDLHKYLPEIGFSESSSSLLPYAYGVMSEERSFSTEREILYQVLFDMKRDIADLRQSLSSLQQQVGVEDRAHSRLSSPPSPQVESPLHAPLSSPPALAAPESPSEVCEVEETALVDEPITIEAAERILILRALKRHQGNKSEAARELAISTRTLYRKLQSYGLDDDDLQDL